MRKLKFTALAIVCSMCLNCGGGTGGTSPTSGGSLVRTFKGTISDSSGTPLANASVLANGNPQTQTDSVGKFSFTIPSDDNTDISVLSGSNEVSLPVPLSVQDSSVITLNATVNSSITQAQVEFLEAGVRAILDCGEEITIQGDVIKVKIPSTGARCRVKYFYFDHGIVYDFGGFLADPTFCPNLIDTNLGEPPVPPQPNTEITLDVIYTLKPGTESCTLAFSILGPAYNQITKVFDIIFEPKT